MWKFEINEQRPQKSGHDIAWPYKQKNMATNYIIEYVWLSWENPWR